MPDPSLDPARQLEMLQAGVTMPAPDAPAAGATQPLAPAAVTNAPVLPVAAAKSTALLTGNMPALQRDFSLRSMQSATTADTRFQS